MTDNMKSAIERLAAAFKAAGYTSTSEKSEGVVLSRNDLISEVYLGTYLNHYSTVVETAGKPYLWQDHIAKSGVWIKIAPVYRHNGTLEDASVAVIIKYYDAMPRLWKPNSVYLGEKDRAIIKAESPTDYTDTGIWMTGGSVKQNRIAKTPAANLTDRKIANIVKKTSAALVGYVVPDYSHLAQDRSKWHKSTEKELMEWGKNRQG